MSNDIRWSIDLRWQDPKQKFGFYGLKDGVPMRLATQPDLNIDWEAFEGIDRHAEQMEYCRDVLPVGRCTAGRWMYFR
jgi:hypothetical protein